MAKRIKQSAALPYRLRRDGTGLEVLLVTSMSRGDWIIPKGVVEPDMTPYDSAAKEAWEEAGVTGRVGTAAVGSYEYDKWGGVCTVAVYDLEVEHTHDAWPECFDRKRRWVTVDEAVGLVRRAEVQHLIRTLPARVAARAADPARS
jgi:8-oxo-dGTP pyrophosphatase MutT (NUDIX family)